MLRIGFVDHHLNNFHANKFLSLLHGPLAELDARVVSAWESDPTGDDWCAKNSIPRAESALAVAEGSDAVIVLAPDNINTHLSLFQQVAPAGKPTMVDKFLSTNLDSARQLVDLAEVRNVRLFSASSLRFAVELEAAIADTPGKRTEAFARGMGEWDGYGVHTLSMVIGLLGADATRVIDTGTERAAAVSLDYGDGRRGWAEVRAASNQWEVFPWSFGFLAGDRAVTGAIADFDGFYANLMRRAVEFFRTGQSPISVLEMLAVVRILETANRSREQGNVWLPLSD